MLISWKYCYQKPMLWEEKTARMVTLVTFQNFVQMAVTHTRTHPGTHREPGKFSRFLKLSKSRVCQSWQFLLLSPDSTEISFHSNYRRVISVSPAVWHSYLMGHGMNDEYKIVRWNNSRKIQGWGEHDEKEKLVTVFTKHVPSLLSKLNSVKMSIPSIIFWKKNASTSSVIKIYHDTGQLHQHVEACIQQ